MATFRALAAWFNGPRRLVAFSLIGWVVVLGISTGQAPESDVWFVVPDLGDLLLMVIVGVVVVSGWALMLYIRPPIRGGRHREATRSLRALIIVVTALVILLLAFGPDEALEPDVAGEPEPVPAVEQEVTGSVEEAPAGTRDIDVVALVVISVIAGAVLLLSSRRAASFGSDSGHAADELLEADLGPAIDEANRRLNLGADPRMAVLAAYDSLEKALAEQGRHRHPAETPTEHMRRVLAAVPALSGPAVRLGRLYEVARFSDHPITSEDRDHAAAALEEARATFLVRGRDAP